MLYTVYDTHIKSKSIRISLETVDKNVAIKLVNETNQEYRHINMPYICKMYEGSAEDLV